MSSTAPSQIVAYLNQVFKNRDKLDLAILEQEAGALAGFLELYDRMPDELIRLAPDQYALLISSVAAIRLRTDQYRGGANVDVLRPLALALPRAWKLIETLPDQPVARQNDLQFISDLDLREMIGQDLSAIETALSSAEWKGATLFAGSCCEALLLYGLQTRETKTRGEIQKAVTAIKWPSKAPNAADLTDRSWDLFSYSEVAQHLQLILKNTRDELNAVREYRNLIHPAKTVRDKAKFDRGTALVGAGTVEHVLSDLRRNL